MPDTPKVVRPTFTRGLDFLWARERCLPSTPPRMCCTDILHVIGASVVFARVRTEKIPVSLGNRMLGRVAATPLHARCGQPPAVYFVRAIALPRSQNVAFSLWANTVTKLWMWATWCPPFVFDAACVPLSGGSATTSLLSCFSMSDPGPSPVVRECGSVCVCARACVLVCRVPMCCERVMLLSCTKSLVLSQVPTCVRP